MTIGERIKEARKFKKMSQEEMGRLLDIGKSSVCEWEAGKRAIPIDIIEKIAEILDTSVPHLMGWTLTDDNKYTSTTPSPAAMSIARKYDCLDVHGRKAVEAIMDVEVARMTDNYAQETERFNQYAQVSDDLIESNA